MTSLGSSGLVDGAVRWIVRGYDSQSRVNAITSYDAATGHNVVNRVQINYNGHGLVKQVFQDHDGVVDGSSQLVAYNYDDGQTSGSTTAARFVRLASVAYPGGRVN